MRLVVDWDGTATMADTMDALVRRFGDGRVVDRWAELLKDKDERPATLHDVISDELATVRRPLASVIPWLLETVQIRPGFHELVDEYKPLILSSNVRELIEPVLAREGIDVELRANALASSGPAGWKVDFLYGDTCEACGESCKRGSLPEGEVVYIGDGSSDRCAAQAADRVFARGSLARYLERRGVPFEPFEDFLEVRRALAASTV